METFESVVKASDSTEALKLWDEVKTKIYSLEPHELELGFGDKITCSTYYSPNVKKEDAELVQEFMNQEKISAYNTRLFKNEKGDFELRIASAQKKDPKTHQYKGMCFSLCLLAKGKILQLCMVIMRMR